MDTDHMNLLREIQQLDFVLIELSLYLDTHPNDKKPLEYHNRVSYDSRQLKEKYEQQYGPLTLGGFSPPQYPWQWVENPWPWELNY